MIYGDGIKKNNKVMTKDNGIGIRTAELINLARKTLDTAVSIESKHNPDNTETVKKLNRISKELFNVLVDDGYDPFNV